jgi:hypothetical protein
LGYQPKAAPLSRYILREHAVYLLAKSLFYIYKRSFSSANVFLAYSMPGNG